MPADGRSPDRNPGSHHTLHLVLLPPQPRSLLLLWLQGSARRGSQGGHLEAAPQVNTQTASIGKTQGQIHLFTWQHPSDYAEQLWVLSVFLRASPPSGQRGNDVASV